MVIVGAVGVELIFLAFFRALVVGIDEVDELFQFFPLDMFLRGQLFIADVEEIPESLIGFDHVVEGIECEVVIDDFLFILIFLVGEFEVDIDDFLYLSAALFQFQVVFVYVVDHHPVEGVVFVGLEGVLVQDGLRVFPDVLLDILSGAEGTVTRMRISWSR